MRSKSIVLLALALGCGLVASIGISQVMERRNQASTTPGETEAIFVALQDINPNDPITAQNVKIEEWPKSKVQAGAITRIEEYENKRARQKIFLGEPILAGKIIDANELNTASGKIPKGYRVVAVRVDAVSGGANLILPGDRVDVIVFLNKNSSQGIEETKTQTILQDIKVFAVDTVFQRNPGEEEPAIAAKTISLLVTPDQAENVTLASELGTIRFVLRYDQDDAVVATDGASTNDVFGSSGADRNAEQATKAQPSAQPAAATSAGHGFNSLLDMIKHQREKTKPAAPVQASPWKMTVYKGADIEEVEINNEGLPVVLGDTAPSLPQENSSEQPSSEVPSDTPDDAATDAAAIEPASTGAHVSLKE